jgi:polyisoprenoid-binding protein YceI
MILRSILFFTFLFLTVPIFSQNRLMLDTEKSSVVYYAKHPAHKWSGVNNTPKGVIEIENNTPNRIAVKANLADFDSKSANRDANALRIFNAIEFPEVSFYSEDVRLNKKDTLNVKGEFGLSGYKIPQSIDLYYDENELEYVIRGEFMVDLDQTKIRLPRFLFKPIESQIRCEIQLFFIKN